jgi:hypothetical protein
MNENLIPEKIICVACGKRHFPDEETFFTMYGNMTIGLNAGILGNNFNEDGTLGRLQFICRNEECVLKIYQCPEKEY